MKVNIGKDERWPDYYLQPLNHPFGEFSVEIPDDVVKKYYKVLQEYEAMQGILRGYYDNEG